MKIKSLFIILGNPYSRFYTLSSLGFFHHMDDVKYIKKIAKTKMGKELDLENPKTCCEKLNWLKLYNRHPEYTMMVDKYLVKDYVAKTVGPEHVVPLLGVWDSFDEIDFDKLPDQFVLKCNHDGGPVVVKDKSKIDKDSLRKIFKKKLKKNYYYLSREWPYKDVKHKIIAEEYIPSLGHEDSVEYKITCCNGKVKMITVCTGIAHAALELRKNDNFDRDWNKLDFYVYYEPSGITYEKPAYLNELIDFAEKLAKDIPYVRVDCYHVDNKILFGEMTFFTWGGFMDFTPDKWDGIMGDWIELPQKYNESYK